MEFKMTIIIGTAPLNKTVPAVVHDGQTTRLPAGGNSSLATAYKRFLVLVSYYIYMK
jgi:hypothetical protein